MWNTYQKEDRQRTDALDPESENWLIWFLELQSVVTNCQMVLECRWLERTQVVIDESAMTTEWKGFFLSFRAQTVVTAMCTTRSVHNTTCCTHTFSRCFSVIVIRHTLCAERVCAHWLKNEYRVICVLRKILTSIHVSSALSAVPIRSSRCSPSYFSGPFTSDAISAIRIDASKPGMRDSAGSDSIANLNHRTGYEPKYDVDNDT